MNRSKIEYVDHTWNFITGCRHDCQYCYARRMTARFAGNVRLNKMAKKDYSLVPAADGGEDLYVLDAPMMNETGNPLVYPFGFEPTLHKYRMDYPGKLKMGNNIFVGAMSDVFGKWVSDSWLDDMFSVCAQYPIDRRLHNTKMLLRNYHMLKEHAENSVFGRTQMEESAADILESMMSVYDNEVIIESIKRSATRTAIIVSHIEVMFGLYRSYCEHTSSREIDLRRYEVAWDMYMADKTLSAKEIAKKQNISTRNVYEDIKVAMERLSALIFGVDGLKVH